MGRSWDDAIVVETYDKTRSIPSSVLQQFYERLQKLGISLKADVLVLEAGIGTGRTARYLLDHKVRLVGIDLSRAMLEKMREKVKEKPVTNQVNLICGDVTNLPFRNSCFDLVITIHVLHLLERWKWAILESKRVLKRKGFFVVAGATTVVLETTIGKKWNELYQNLYTPKEFWKRVLKKVLPNKILRYLSKKANWETRALTYLNRTASARKTGTIMWKETVYITKIFSALNNRVLTWQWNMSHESHEKIMSALKEWCHKEMKNVHFEEIPRTWSFHVYQF